MSTSTAVDRCHEIKHDTEAAYRIDYLDSTEKIRTLGRDQSGRGEGMMIGQFIASLRAQLKAGRAEPVAPAIAAEPISGFFFRTSSRRWLRGQFGGTIARTRGRHVLACLLAALAATVPARATPPYPVHVVLPLTGNASFLGQGMKLALQLANTTINKQGGIQGTPLEFVFHDDQSSPQMAVQIASQIRSEKSPIVIGSGLVAMCNAMAPMLAAGPVMYCLSPGIHPQPGSKTFTAFISTYDLAQVLTAYYRGRGFTRLAMISSTDASGQDGFAAFENAFKLPENAKMQLVASVRFNPGDVSVAAQVGQMRAARPQAVIVWSSGAPFGTVLKGIVQGGLEVPVATTDANMTFAQMQQYEAFLPREALFMSSLWPLHGSEIALPPAVEAAQKAMFAAYAAAGKKPDITTAAAWDIGMLTAVALGKLGLGASPEQMRAFLAGTRQLAGINGVYDFDRTPQRGLDASDAVVTRWMPDARNWAIVSMPGGAPLKH
jgi:branched-chain amino acid transport system substrate-binding protein